MAAIRDGNPSERSTVSTTVPLRRSSYRCPRLLLLAGCLCLAVAAAPTGSAHAEAGDRRAHGTVSDVDDAPIAGASVELAPADPGRSAPPAVRTDQRGRWSVGGLAPGRYSIRVRAAGFINTDGWLAVPATGTADPVEVQMLPLSWEPPASTRGNPLTLRLWVEKGNSLLEQGQPSPAREIYERVLVQLEPARRPEVLRAIARTHYLEGDITEAVAALRRALEIAPLEADSRRLFTALMESLRRSDEAEAYLAELDARPPPAAADPAPADPAPAAAAMPPEIAAMLAAAPEAPLAHRRGDYKTTFTERSPWSGLTEYARRSGAGIDEIREQDPAAAAYDLATESFQVFVPEAYRPGEGWGLLVWISPTPFGGTRRPEMAEALGRHRLLWIGANRSGNQRPVWDRIGLALDAAHNMLGLYDLDRDRVYVGGYSGGGRAASRIGVLYPELVHAAWSLFGCDYFRPLPVVERPGALWPAKYAPPPPAALELVKRRNRFVLVTGPRDFNFTQTRTTAREMRADGFAHVTYLEIPGADHHTFPGAEWLRRIFEALEPPPASRP